MSLKTTLIVTLAAFGVATEANAQATPNISAAEEFLTGGWVTDPSNRTAALSAGLPNTIPEVPIRVWSAYMTDQVEVTHSITTDRGTTTVASVQESGGVVTQGRNIELRQGNPTGNIVGGGWSALTQPIAPGQFTSFGWGVNPNTSAQLLDLAKPRQFVVTFTGHTNQPCNNGRIKVNVDGNWLKFRSGSVLQVPPGGSVWSYGKSVFVMWDGTCTVSNPAPGAMPLARGSLKLAH